MQHFIADDGAKIFLRISGHGTPLIMLHGWTSSHQEWLPFTSILSERHRVFNWDARGHGGHALLKNAPPTVERMARDLANLIEHYRLEKAVVIGHSMGALTLWQFIRDFGLGALRKICIIDQSPKLVTDDHWDLGIYGNFNQNQAATMMQKLNEDFAETVLRLTAFGLNTKASEKYLAGTSGWERSRMALRAQNPAPLIKCWASLTAADYRDVLAKITVPSMLVYGGQSNFYGLGTAKYVAKQIPDAILHIFADSDHSPHRCEAGRF
ncbi:MAG: alpha/beta hydrolase, partial [Rhodocyclales bacterium GT-UBC]